MSAMLRLGISTFSTLESAVRDRARDLRAIAGPLREAFLRHDLITTYGDHLPATPPPMVTVDGGKIVEQLSAGDLVVCGAVAAEGVKHPGLFTDDGPGTIYHTFVEHTSAVGDFASAVMASQEMTMLTHPDINHDIRIIDGAWTPALFNPIFSMSVSYEGARLFNDYMEWMLDQGLWEGNELLDALDARIAPWRHLDDGYRLVASTKSDTATAYSRLAEGFLRDAGMPPRAGGTLTDRKVAGLVLQPGEMLSPQTLALKAGPWMERSEPGKRGLAALEQDHITSEHYEKMKRIIEGYSGVTDPADADDLSVLDRMDVTNDEAWLWTTYYRMSGGGEYTRPSRLDFTRLGTDVDDDGNALGSKVSDSIAPVIAALDDDTAGSVTLETMSQYNADVRAKEVSTVAKADRFQLANVLDDEETMVGVLRQYRT